MDRVDRKIKIGDCDWLKLWISRSLFLLVSFLFFDNYAYFCV